MVKASSRTRHPRLDRTSRRARRSGRAVCRRTRRIGARSRAAERKSRRNWINWCAGPVSVEAFSSYVTMNARFHALLTELSGSAPLIRQIDRASALPFASPSGFVMAQSALPEAHQILIIAQDHHRIVVDAIENREGARAEAVMREHARLAARNLRLALRNRTHLDLSAGAGADPRARERIGRSHVMRFAHKLDPMHRSRHP